MIINPTEQSKTKKSEYKEFPTLYDLDSVVDSSEI